MQVKGTADRPKTATVLTHRRADDTAEALKQLIDAAKRADVTLRFDPRETTKHALKPDDCVHTNSEIDPNVDICIVLGGDGTILAGLKEYADTDVPVFAVKYGDVGFLATVDPNGLDDHFDRAFSGDFERRKLPAITATMGGQLVGESASSVAFNDISLHRKPGGRVAELAYSLSDEEIGHVRCDGIVVCTPAGSTGYNLANGGPVLAWGVEGYIVSFIAPHSLTARPLVIAPNDLLVVKNVSKYEAVEVHADGRPVFELPKNASLEVRFGDRQGTLALLSGTNFYHRLRERFGRLAH